MRSRPFAIATYPVLVWFLYFGVMFAFFLVPLINFAMHHMALMDAINVAFLLAGCLYWWPIVGLDPIVHWRMGYGTKLAALSLGVPFEAFLGVAIMSLRTPIASMYSLNSTHSGGALLWAATELAIFIGLIPVFLQWVRADERAGARADARANRAARARNAPRSPASSRSQPRSVARPWFRLRHRGEVPTAVPAGQQQLGGALEGEGRFRTLDFGPARRRQRWSGPGGRAPQGPRQRGPAQGPVAAGLTRAQRSSSPAGVSSSGRGP